MIAAARQRMGGQLAMLLEPENVAQEIEDYRRARYRQGADPEQVDREVRRRFGADLDALGMDEVGTPDAFGTPRAEAPADGEPGLFD